MLLWAVLLGAGPSLIHVENLHFRYPSAAAPALDGLSLEVPTGSLYGLLGPNGSGKTTLLSLLAGILEAPAGAIRVDGMDLSAQLARVQARSALVPQDLAFYPRLSVQENLEFFAGVGGLGPAALSERVEEALRLAALLPSRHLRAERCSGGLKRRLNIAIGLLRKPALLLLDEPTVGIDPQSRRFILRSVREIHAAGTTVVYASHYMEEVQELCDTVGVLDRGKLLAQGNMDTLLAGDAGREGVHNLESLFLRLTQTELRD
jgi:ABC-2 type transport system ATP-binding protein